MIGRSGFDRSGRSGGRRGLDRDDGTPAGVERGCDRESRAADPAMRTRLPFAALAYVCTALALAGVVLPGLPTTPFVLVAAWAASRGCPSVHRWLHRHCLLGPLLRAWETQRAVPTRAKWTAVGLLGASWGAMFLYTDGPLVPALTAPLFIAIALFVTTRPAPRPQAEAAPPQT